MYRNLLVKDGILSTTVSSWVKAFNIAANSDNEFQSLNHCWPAGHAKARRRITTSFALANKFILKPIHNSGLSGLSDNHKISLHSGKFRQEYPSSLLNFLSLPYSTNRFYTEKSGTSFRNRVLDRNYPPNLSSLKIARTQLRLYKKENTTCDHRTKRA